MSYHLPLVANTNKVYLHVSALRVFLAGEVDGLPEEKRKGTPLGHVKALSQSLIIPQNPASLHAPSFT